jgi:DNA-binding transcriptional regulator YiaG
MPGENVATLIFDKHPELKSLSQKHLRAVKAAIHEAIMFSSNEMLNPEATERLFKKLVPDSGKPSAALRAYRKRQSLTQKELAKTSGVPLSHISAMEKGQRPITSTEARKLALPLNTHFKRLI